MFFNLVHGSNSVLEIIGGLPQYSDEDAVSVYNPESFQLVTELEAPLDHDFETVPKGIKFPEKDPPYNDICMDFIEFQQPLDSVFLKEINKDLRRSLLHDEPEHAEPLNRVLLTYAGYHKIPGYLSGMHFIAATLLNLGIYSESQVYDGLAWFVEKVGTDFFSEGMRGVLITTEKAIELLQKKLRKRIVNPENFTIIIQPLFASLFFDKLEISDLQETWKYYYDVLETQKPPKNSHDAIANVTCYFLIKCQKCFITASDEGIVEISLCLRECMRDHVKFDRNDFNRLFS
jgi:Rab-GTPase-TBC domain